MTDVEKILNARDDFEFFCTEILGLDIAEHHKKIIDALIKHKFTLIMASRGHGKTEISIAYVLWKTFYSHDMEIMLISSSLLQSYRVLERIKMYIDNNEYLKVLRPKYVGGLDWEDWKETWSKQEIRTSTNCKVMCRPFNSTIRGNHVHECICDDILRNDVGVTNITPEQAKKIFVEDIRPIVNTFNGNMRIIGTPIGEDDLLYTIKTEIPDYYVVELKCVVEDENGKWLRPIWPARFTLVDEPGKVNLYKLRTEMNKISPFSFDKEYLLNPISSGTSIFDIEVVRKQTFPENTQFVKKVNCYYYCGVDVALSQNDAADFTVISIIEEDEKNVARCIKQDRFQGESQTNILKRIQYWHEIFDFIQIYIEQTGLSYGMIRQANEDAMFDDKENRIKGLVEGFKTNQASKEKIIGQLMYAFSVGNLFIPDDSNLLQELTGFSIVKRRNGASRLEGRRIHDDRVMSLAISYDCYLTYASAPVSVSFV